MRHFTILIIEGSAGSAEVVAQLFCRTFLGSTVSRIRREGLRDYLTSAKREGQTCDLIVDLEILGDNYLGNACEEIGAHMPNTAVVHLCGPSKDHHGVARHLCERHQGPRTLPAIAVVHCTADWEKTLLRQVKIALILRTAKQRLQRLTPDA